MKISLLRKGWCCRNEWYIRILEHLGRTQNQFLGENGCILWMGRLKKMGISSLFPLFIFTLVNLLNAVSPYCITIFFVTCHSMHFLFISIYFFIYFGFSFGFSKRLFYSLVWRVREDFCMTIFIGIFIRFRKIVVPI